MNEGKGQYIGIILISILVYIIMMRTCAPEAQDFLDENEQNTEETLSSDSTKQISTDNVTLDLDSLNDSTRLSIQQQEANSKYGPFSTYTLGTSEDITIENNLIKLVLQSKGAQVKQVNLKTFTDFNKNPLLLIDESQEINYTFFINGNREINTKDLYFKSNKTENSVQFIAQVGNGKALKITYTLNPDSYLVDYDVSFTNFNELFSSTSDRVILNWDYTSLNHERDIKSEKQKSTAYWKTTDNDVNHLGIGRSKEKSIEESTTWLSYKQRFFNTTLLLKSGAFKTLDIATSIDNDIETEVAFYDGKLVLPVAKQNSNSDYAMQFYFGPNDYKLLKGLKNGMHNVVELSADFFLFRWVKWINAWLIIPLFNFLEQYIPSYGIIILIMTLIIKLLLMPLTLKSYVSTAKTKVLKPELDELREKYGSDSAGYSRAQMELYNKAGVSMFGGCLPMLLQMPFLLAMFYFFPSSIELRQESFLWAQDLSTFDTVPFLTWSANIPLLGNHLSIFTLLMTASSILMARFNPQMQSQPTQPGMEVMKYMPYIFPFFLLFLFNNFPAALTYYYFLSNMITFGQQIIINKFFIDEDKLHAQIQENKKKPKKKSAFAAKMEEMYKQQQQMQEQQKNKKK